MSRTASRERPSLDPDQIIDALLILAKDADPTAISFRRLGDALGSHPTAVYRHFGSKHQLVDAALDRLMLDVLDRIPAELDWRQRWIFAATAFLDSAVAHPAIGVEVIDRIHTGPGERRTIELLLTCLREAGLDDDQIAEHYALVSGYSMAMIAAEAGFRISYDAEPSGRQEAWLVVPPTPDPATEPLLTRFLPELEALDSANVFRSGLEAILDVVERAGAANRTRD